MQTPTTRPAATPTTLITGLSTPKGFTICGKSPSGPASRATPTTKPPIPRPANQATGRQRGEGSLLSGNSSSRNVVGTNTSTIHYHEANHGPVPPSLL